MAIYYVLTCEYNLHTIISDMVNGDYVTYHCDGNRIDSVYPAFL
jgi:hypothetical protein